MHNANFWRGYFRTSFKPHLERTLQVLEERLLPSFDGIEAEATALREQTYQDLVSMPIEHDAADESMLAQAAFEAGFDYYAGMDAIRQALVNSFAPMLYHTWEQQLLAFHRKEMLDPTEEHSNALLKLSVLRKRLAATGIDLSQLSTWSDIDQLRVVANTVKHADGESADILKAQRPDFFDPTRMNGQLAAMPFRVTPSVYRPMSGEDLYLTVGDIKAYGASTIRFWDEFADALERS
ncbi:hypothetical protein [Burkholderia vietnamiensis]|uniref:hypothetical protein n=1 Tax=Burkholderia vietnamiensis TaxID=60552 RepID=UPI000753AF46|nr:hypothetical protein [Burkholderia vietnamiensis]MCO1351643.1 hypothetical protein [Burkholderia vietnamiensis]UQN50932.1 hypothetical protein L0Y95_29275 [Burkholderia vietnamiensis]